MDAKYIERLHKKERRKWWKLRKDMKKLQENPNIDSYIWIKILQEILENKSRIRKNVKSVMVFTVLEKFDEMQGVSEKYFSKVYYPLFPYCYGKNGFLYEKMKSIAYEKMTNPEITAKIKFTQRKIPAQRELPLIFPIASSSR